MYFTWKYTNYCLKMFKLFELLKVFASSQKVVAFLLLFCLHSVQEKQIFIYLLFTAGFLLLELDYS